MKKWFMMAALLGSLMMGCATAPVVLAPVGPNPMGFQSAGGNGQLEVYSAVSNHREGVNPTWAQHTDYSIYSQGGKRLEHVYNRTGYYSESPRIVVLPAGEYVMEARAKGILRVRVPVVVKVGEVTSVHLDGKWQPGSTPPQTALVSAPMGYPVGWRAGQ